MSRGIPNPSVFSPTINLESSGKHVGHFKIPHSRDDAGWGDLMVPMVSIKSGTGPCILFTAGSHGDEYEGQIALRTLTADLNPDDVAGQVLMVPSMNLPAVLNISRLSPIDGKNMNRVFPGNPRGTITEKIASFVYDELVQRADCVVDLHAGGKSLAMACWAMMHEYPDKQITKETLELMRAFTAPIGLVFESEPDREGMLDTVVEDLGKPFIAIELGGCGTVSVNTLRVAMRGIRNSLIHCGVTRGDIEPGEQPTAIMTVPPDGFVLAQDHGLFEPLVELDDELDEGQAVGRIHSVHRPDREPIVHYAQAAGRVIGRRAHGLTAHGDYLFALAVPFAESY